ncbi:MAG: hypothetical protein WDN28_07075 [Chthoniobacter sp.]
MKGLFAPRKNNPWLEWLLVVLIFLASNLNSALRQKQNTLNGGTAWETPYYKVAQQFVLHQPREGEAPYVFRLGTPWLVSLLNSHDALRAVRIAHLTGLAATTVEGPFTYGIGAQWLTSFVSPPELFRGFRIVNITGSALAVILLVFWLRGYVSDWRIRTLLVTLFVMQWDAPPRLVYHSPVHVDAWLFVFVLAGLLVLRRYLAQPSAGALVALSALAIGGAYFREATLFVPLSLMAAHRPLVEEHGHWHWRLPPWPACLPFFCGFLAFLSTRHFAHQTDGYSFFQTIFRFLYDKPVLTYIHAWFLAFGPVLCILLFDWKGARDFLWKEQWLALFLLAGAGFGFVGGTDTERLQYWSMPGVYLLLGRAIERHRATLSSGALVAVLAIGQILSSRILWTTPDYPTDFQHTFPLLQQFGSQGPTARPLLLPRLPAQGGAFPRAVSPFRRGRALLDAPPRPANRALRQCGGPPIVSRGSLF